MPAILGRLVRQKPSRRETRGSKNLFYLRLQGAENGAGLQKHGNTSNVGRYMALRTKRKQCCRTTTHAYRLQLHDGFQAGACSRRLGGSTQRERDGSPQWAVGENMFDVEAAVHTYMGQSTHGA